MIDPCTSQGTLDHLRPHLGEFKIYVEQHARQVMEHLGIPTDQLNATHTTIYDFNANGMHPMGKIKLKCQIKA